MTKIKKLTMTLVALFAMTAGARADWTGETYTATANENLGAITVNADATLTINEGVTVTVTGGINVASGTLTVTGPGTLVVTGANGNIGGSGGDFGGPGGNGGVAISGNIIVQGGATVTATGGTGGTGGYGSMNGGNGGNGGNAFAGTLTYKSGTVTANGGSGGSGGVDSREYPSPSGSAGKAFANDVDFTQTTGYSVTNGTSTIESVLDQTKVVISGGTEPEPPIEVTPVALSYEAKVFDLPASWASDNTPISAADMPEDFVQITTDEAKALAVSDGIVVLIYGFNGDKVKEMIFQNGTYMHESEGQEARKNIIGYQTDLNAKICYPAVTVTEPANTNQWQFTMPASDVVLTPIYAPVAQWATESDVKLLPTAAEGIFAGTTDPIIVEGTVAPGQGTVMYAVTSTNQATAPELAAFSATVPTAENIADEGADVLVWYYIQGAATPDGQEATAENTFNDSEICATPLEVSVLSNQFDITFNAANANTIEAGKATVTVGGTAATVTEGRLEAVKMGSTVTINAKQGYKFRKVEAKKKPALQAQRNSYETVEDNWE